VAGEGGQVVLVVNAIPVYGRSDRNVEWDDLKRYTGLTTSVEAKQGAKGRQKGASLSTPFEPLCE
jgi:hypothetical protein